MFAKRMDEIEDLGCTERKLLGLKPAGKNYVTFRKGHLQVDVRGFIKSDAGKASVESVIRRAPGKKPEDAEGPQSSHEARR